MVDHEKQRARYVAGTEGAPPVPPPGGYRGARRATGASAPVLPTVHTAPAEEKQPANAWGWVALVASILFALILLGILLAGGTDSIYSVTMLALQLVVVAVVVAALVTARGRMLGAIALVIALLLNVATVGAMSAVQTSASGNYEGVKSEKQKHEEAYPGIKNVSPTDVLSQPSLEEVRATSDALLADIRDELSAEFGYTWAPAGDEDIRPERNGYGGESMLVQRSSAAWATNEPVQDYARKQEIMRVIDRVLTRHGLWGLVSLNDPSSGLEPSMLAKLYGSDDPRTQNTWEWYSDNYPDPLRFYATIYDLSNDPSGEFRAEREAQNAQTGEPLEGLQIFVYSRQLLSEADRDEFQKRIQDYPGF